MSTTDKQIAEIIEWFDFEKVRRCMLLMNWQWVGVGVPSINQLETKAVQLLRDAADLGDQHCSVACGGFCASNHNGTLKLQFVVTDWDCC